MGTVGGMLLGRKWCGVISRLHVIKKYSLSLFNDCGLSELNVLKLWSVCALTA